MGKFTDPDDFGTALFALLVIAFIARWAVIAAFFGALAWVAIRLWG